MGCYVGVDLGSFSCKVALVGRGEVLGALAFPSGTDYARSAGEAISRLLSEHGIPARSVGGTVVTGVGGRALERLGAFVGDVLCTARGISAVAPSVRTVIDLGAQSTRVVWLDEKGRVAHFATNEKCATGSGRFLQVVANVLRVRLEEVGPLSVHSERPVTFTTGCAVFGESEAITRVSEGEAKEDILAGVHRALAEKVAGLLGSRGIQGDCAVCGGGALDVGLLRQLERQLGRAVHVPGAPQVVGAIGAAVQAQRGADASLPPVRPAGVAPFRRRPAPGAVVFGRRRTEPARTRRMTR
ncbi:MAG: 2-hydroxyglutaryl-CoA dehydratase [Deltaproteobacteria bacterium]|nr:2-hydroxyglutaryl-CoA dehydratase [Deltaproteobacteria bacterium]